MIFGANLILFSFTGAILVFYAELNRAIGPRPPAALVSVAPLKQSVVTNWKPLQPVVTKILAEYPGAHPAHIRLAPALKSQAAIHSDLDLYHRLDIDLPVPASGSADQERDADPEHINIFIDPVSGHYAQSEDRADPLRWIFHLHATFFAGSLGKTLLGIVGLALLVSSVTGLLIYGPFSKGQTFRAPKTLIRNTLDRNTIQENQSVNRRLFFADWHKLIGILSLAFQLLMATTGLLLTLGTLVIQIYTYVVISQLHESSSDQSSPVATQVSPKSADWVDLDRVFAQAREIHTDERYVKTILFPGEVQGPNHFGVLAHGTGIFGQYIPQLSMLKAASANDARADMIINLPWYIQLIAAAAPLHFGNFGGLPVKILYCFFGLTSGGLAITGYVMYTIKYRRRRHSV